MRPSRLFHERGFIARSASVTLVFAVTLLPWASARADEGGVPFWFSGAVTRASPLCRQPGLVAASMPYYYDGSADKSKTFQRGDTLWRASNRAAVAPRSAEVRARHEVPRRPALVGLGGVSATTVRRPTSRCLRRANVRSQRLDHGRHRSVSRREPRMDEGNDNWMTYLTGDIPVGAYQQKRSRQHRHRSWRDRRGRRVHLSQQQDRAGVFRRGGLHLQLGEHHTNYKNGVDSHLDWAVSQFLSANWEVGVAGYVYYQLTGDSGCGDRSGRSSRGSHRSAPRSATRSVQRPAGVCEPAWLLGVLGGEPDRGLCGVRDAQHSAWEPRQIAVGENKESPE